jgi:surface antigen
MAIHYFRSAVCLSWHKYRFYDAAPIVHSRLTKAFVLFAALSLGSCETINEMNDWIKGNPDKVKIAAFGGLGGLLIAGHFTGAALPAIVAGVGGAAIGWKVRSIMSDEEKEANAEAVKFAAEGPTSKEYAWINPETDSEGAAKAVENTRTTTYGDKCRKIEAMVKTTDDARIEQQTIYRLTDGCWKIAG